MVIKEEEILAYTIAIFVMGGSLTWLFINETFFFWIFLIIYGIGGIYYFSKKD